MERLEDKFVRKCSFSFILILPVSDSKLKSIKLSENIVFSINLNVA